MTDFRAKNIIRTRHDPENPYFLMSRRTAQDKNLSYEAQGLLTYLLSQSDSWEIRIDDLQKKGCKRDKVYRILKELKDAGYIHREKTRDKNGKFIWGDYIVYEHPFTEKPDTVKPDTEIQEISTISTKGNEESPTPEEKPVSAPTPKPMIPAVNRPLEMYTAYKTTILEHLEHTHQDWLLDAYTSKLIDLANRMSQKGYTVEDVTNTLRYKIKDRVSPYSFYYLEKDIPVYRSQQLTVYNTDAYKEYHAPPVPVITEEQKQAALKAQAESKAERAKGNAA